ncbi:MAG: D-alanine--D-alanine ligase [Gammaproteobacteria bacterium]|nr:D-alanine--D-alanine ligase [Gammaproteobacteria bacterium]
MTTSSDFGRVAVFYGGNSHEREISLQSGAAVAGGLRAAGVDVKLVDTADHHIDFSSFDRVFIALHGRDGEDGKIQALLDYYDIPYTGSNVPASAVSMNKWYTKAVWQSAGINTPKYKIVGDMFDADYDGIDLPVYVKPANEGSSIGVTHVTEASLLGDAIERAREYDDFIVIEQAIRGKEYTYSFIDGVQEMPLICLEPTTDFYDYDAKYLRDDTRYIVDPPLDKALTRQCVSSAVLAYESLGMNGWGRVDFIIDENDEVWFIEVNSVPGMTSHSLVPMSAQAAGLDFNSTCLAILESSLHG